MPDLGELFDPTKIAPRSYAVPSGTYKAMITASDMVENKKKDGSFLLLTHVILEGQYKGAKIDARLNLINKNPTTVAIAQQSLAEILRALNLGPTRRSEALHNKPLVIRVEHLEADPQVGRKYANNDIKAWLAIESGAPCEQKPSFYNEGIKEEPQTQEVVQEDTPWPKRQAGGE